MDFLDEIQHRALAGDAAMQPRLREMGIIADGCWEELCVSAAEAVAAVHEEFVAAGARLIRTNTFGANAVQLEKHGLEHRVSEINWSAAQLARDSARGKGVYVAGRVGPLGITDDEARAHGVDRAKVFEEQIGALLDGGAQLICLESFADMDEMLIALRAKQTLHHCPAICSFACPAGGSLADGAQLAAAFTRLVEADADIVGVDSVPDPHVMARLIERLPSGLLLAAFPEDSDTDTPSTATTLEEFSGGVLELARQGARLLSGGRGTRPQHVAAVVAVLDSLNPKAPERPAA